MIMIINNNYNYHYFIIIIIVIIIIIICIYIYIYMYTGQDRTPGGVESPRFTNAGACEPKDSSGKKRGRYLIAPTQGVESGACC